MWIMIALASVGSLVWIGIAFLPWRPWSTREQFEVSKEQSSASLEDVTVLIPARNEEAEISRSLESLNRQSGDATEKNNSLRVVLIDDQSEDQTVEVAKNKFNGSMIILRGKDLPEKWTGKLWALQQGLREVKTKYCVLMDADIELQPNLIAQIKDKLEQESLDYVSLMASLRTETFFEKLIIPAYIYFFKLLYPFRLANNSSSRVAAGAGGFVFVKTEVLRKSGAFESLQAAIIDDCELAHQIKSTGHRIWIGLSKSVSSHRGYQSLGELWNLVARTAFTFLRYRVSLLLGCSAILLSAFVFLPAALFIPQIGLAWKLFFAAGLVAMGMTYAPTLRFYRLHLGLLFVFPLTGLLYLMMVWSSAYRYFRGSRSEWKGRAYSRHEVKHEADFKKAS